MSYSGTVTNGSNTLSNRNSFALGTYEETYKELSKLQRCPIIRRNSETKTSRDLPFNWAGRLLARLQRQLYRFADGKVGARHRCAAKKKAQQCRAAKKKAQQCRAATLGDLLQ